MKKDQEKLTREKKLRSDIGSFEKQHKAAMARNTKMAEKVFNGMKGTILVKADRWAKMHEEAKKEKVDHDEVRQERKVEDADRARLVSQAIKIQNFEQSRAKDKTEIKELKKVK